MNLSDGERLLILRLVERCRDDGPAMAAVVEHLMEQDPEVRARATDGLDDDVWWPEMGGVVTVLATGEQGFVRSLRLDDPPTFVVSLDRDRETRRLRLDELGPAAAAPHPDAARLDWLQAHDADLREDSGKWWVEPRLGCRTHRDSPDARTAIDRAIDRNKET